MRKNYIRNQVDGQLKELRWTNSHSNIQPPFDSVRVQRIQRGRFFASPATKYRSRPVPNGQGFSISVRVRQSFGKNYQVAGQVGVSKYIIFFSHLFQLEIQAVAIKVVPFWQQLGQHKQKHQQFYNVRAFTASNKCRAVSFDARSSLLFSLLWIGDACSAPLAACIAGHTKGHFTGQPILPATSYISELNLGYKLQ